MGVIVERIGTAAFELIRNRLFAIVADELFQQAAITYDDDFLDATVYMERYVPFQVTEMPALNVTYAGMVPLRESKNSAHREYRYFIDVYGASPTTADERGDRRSSMRVQRLMAVVDAILRDKRYITLGFAAPFIMNTRTDAMNVGNQSDTKDASNICLARLEFIVAVPENVQDIQPRTLDSYVTQVTIDNTDLGYVFSGTNPNPLPQNQSDIFVNNTKIIELDEGENYNVRVLDTDTLNEVGAYDAYLDAWLIPSPTTPSIDVYVNNDLIYPALTGNKNVRVVDEDTGLPVGTYDAYLDEILIPAAISNISYLRISPHPSISPSQYPYDIVWHINNTDYFNPLSPGLIPILDKSDNTVLVTANIFGSYSRVTNDKGNQNYTDAGGGITSDGATANYAIDHLTGLGWWLLSSVSASTSWDDAAAAIFVKTETAFDSSVYANWRMPTRKDIELIEDFNVNDHIFNGIESWTGAIHWLMDATTAANASIWTESQSYWSGLLFRGFSKSANPAVYGIACRNHY
jgi:hypothetical protein